MTNSNYADADIVRQFSDELRAIAAALLNKRLWHRVSPADVEQSAWGSFFRIKDTKGADWEDEGALRTILMWHVRRKVMKAVDTHCKAEKRSINRESDSSHMPRSSAPAPDQLASLRDEIQFRLTQLSEELKEVAVLAMTDVSKAAIAQELDLSRRTVERRIARIKEIWKSDP